MKSTRVFLVAVTLISGCATSLAPTDNFNDWSNPVAYHHYQQERSSTAASMQVQADKDGAEGE